MIKVQIFSWNPYQENSYVFYDETGECAIIDPGMYSGEDENRLVSFIRQEKLTPVLLLNTHCHIDHVLGNKFVHDVYGLLPQFHEGEAALLAAVPAYAPEMGIRYEVSPMPETFLPESGSVTFGGSTLDLIFAPGHSPAHLCFYSKADKVLAGGDVLFRGSIGRADLPGGNYDQLINSIETQLFTLPGDVVVYPGHGPETTIAYEKRHNPFFR
ncbi:MBL fold metallo-hydrolase [Hufsiella ginkgonis]|uniref:MBL fold metallo-hydrolase n=1 Tax=Hufsiella ginkgonis TaxID=2695274 RepID=A0A7K1XW07_9SPHI|nr:MBL fold metallo-hydrolase [Hufsiella ginkgonis]MXV14959.1 MBL fold metallo-hydrolase [Hufsiella ginkgonis]